MLSLLLCAVAALSPPPSHIDDPVDIDAAPAPTPAPPPEQTETPEKTGTPEKTETPEKAEEPEKAKKVKAKVEARVVAGARLVSEEPAVDSTGTPVGLPVRKGSLDLRQARVGVDVRYLDILQVRVSAELSDLLDNPKPGKVLRNAWANIAIRPGFQIKVGHFKRAFSRLEMRGFSSIPYVDRGLFNGFAIEDLGWGDRAVGMSVWGDIEPARPGLHRFRWYLGASNNVVAGAPHGLDSHARVTYDPLAWLSLGINGAYKYVQDGLADEAVCRSTWKRDASCRRNVFGAGGDLTFDVKDFYASVEANVVQDWSYADTSPWVLGALGYASYDIRVGPRTRLQPVLFGEYVDTNLSFAESEAVRAGATFNVLWTKHLRVIPQVEFIAPLAPVTAFNRFVPRQTYALWIAVQL